MFMEIIMEELCKYLGENVPRAEQISVKNIWTDLEEPVCFFSVNLSAPTQKNVT